MWEFGFFKFWCAKTWILRIKKLLGRTHIEGSEIDIKTFAAKRCCVWGKPTISLKVIFFSPSAYKARTVNKMPQSGVGSMQGPPKVLFYRRSSSSLGRLPPKVVFHERLSSTDSRLPLPPKVFFH